MENKVRDDDPIEEVRNPLGYCEKGDKMIGPKNCRDCGKCPAGK